MQNNAEKTQKIQIPPAALTGRRQDDTTEAKKELRQAIQDSHDVLVTVSTVFPLTLFPDTVTLDRTKMTITTRKFFNVSEVMSIRMEDLLNVTANVGPLFGTVTIMTRIMNNDKPYAVERLWRDDAFKLKRIAQGYIIALQKEIDCSQLKTKELIDMLDKLGKDDHPEN